MYASNEARDGDIDELASASPSVLRDRFLGSTTVIGEWVEELPDDLAETTIERTPGGRQFPAGDVGVMRTREVEIHHADLALDYTAADWMPEFVVLLLDSRAGAEHDGEPFGAHATDLDRSWEFGTRRSHGVGRRERSGLVADGPGRRRRTDQRRRPRAEDGAVVSYTGDVTPGGPADTRELDALTITKVAVDEKMSNNCYLLTCKHTGEQVLIDAADDLGDPAAADRRRRADPRAHHPPALGPPPRAGRRRRAPPRPPPSPASPTPPPSPSRPASRSPVEVEQGDTVPSATARSR